MKRISLSIHESQFEAIESRAYELGLKPGIYARKVVLQSVSESIVNYSSGLAMAGLGGEHISSTDNAKMIVERHIGDKVQEHFIALNLTNKHRLHSVTTVHIGGMGCSMVEPASVFRQVVIHGLPSVIVAHNHPSSETKPSNEDVMITERLIAAGKLMGIHVLDHIIVGNAGSPYSFRDSLPNMF